MNTARKVIEFLLLYARLIRRDGESPETALDRAAKELPTLAELARDMRGDR